MPVRLAAAAKLGLDIYPVLRGTPDAELQGNLLLDHLFGAHITFIDATDLYSQLSVDTMNAITAELRSKGRKPYVIDMRYATGPLASIGFVAASVELTRQLAEMDIHPNYHFLSTGSGTTQAGLVLGASLLGVEYEVVGISVQQPTGKMTPRIVEKEYVLAATGCGASSTRILFRHVFPNAVNPVMILASLHLGQMIIAEASLSYLGLGIQPPDISWGGMIADGRNYLGRAWWAATFPGVANAATVLVMGLFGDEVRDALNPKFSFN